MQEQRQINKIIKTRRNKFVGHEQYNKFIIIIIEGEINGKRERGRPRDTNLWNIKNQLSQISYEKTKK